MTDRIEAIRARHRARVAVGATPGVDDDVAYLLDEVTRLLAIKRVPPRDHRCPTCSHCLIMEHEKKKAADFSERYEIAHDSFMASSREVDRLRGILDGFDTAMRAPRERQGRALNEVWTAWLDDALTPVAPDAEPGGAQ